jgi:hypothetical protein
MDRTEELARLEELGKQLSRSRALLQSLVSEYVNADRSGPARAIRQIGARIIDAETEVEELAQMVREGGF